MLTLLHVMFQFVLTSSDPSWTCEVTHREPGLSGTFYMYCAKTIDGAEMATVGRFIPDHKDAQ